VGKKKEKPKHGCKGGSFLGNAEIIKKEKLYFEKSIKGGGGRGEKKGGKKEERKCKVAWYPASRKEIFDMHADTEVRDTQR